MWHCGCVAVAMWLSGFVAVGAGSSFLIQFISNAKLERMACFGIFLAFFGHFLMCLVIFD